MEDDVEVMVIHEEEAVQVRSVNVRLSHLKLGQVSFRLLRVNERVEADGEMEDDVEVGVIHEEEAGGLREVVELLFPETDFFQALK